MSLRISMRKAVASVVATAVILMGCGGESAESMLASARNYLEKHDDKAAVIQLKNALQSNPNLAEARFLLGRVLLESGDPVAAEVELRKAKGLNFPADQVIPELARTQLLLGQPKRLVDEYSDTKLGTPDASADLQSSLGLAYLTLGKVDDAERNLAAALATVSGYGPAVVGQARIKASKRDFSAALALLDDVLAKSPRLVDGWQLKGDVLYAMGDHPGSTVAYTKALEVKPDHLPAQAALISRYLEDGKLDDADKQLQQMKKFAPRNPQTTYLQALLAYRQKNLKTARENIQQFLKFLPDSTLGLQLAGLIEYDMKSYLLAETYLLKALPNSPELGSARRVLIMTYLNSNQPAKAMSILQPILSKIADDSNMLNVAGEVFMQTGDVEKAETYFKKSSELDPTNAGKKTSLALSHLASGQTEVAYRELEAIASSENDIKADMALFSSYLSKKRFDQALKVIDGIDKKQADSPLVPHLRGLVKLGQGDVSGARTYFENALQKKPDYYPAVAGLANLDIADKKPELARQRFEKAVAADPKNVQALLALAGLKARLGARVEDVVDLLGKAIASNPSEAQARLALIDYYLSIKNTEKALAAAQEAASTLPTHPEVLDALGRTQQAAQDFNQSLLTYGKLAGLLPNSPQPYLRMADTHLAAKDKEAALQSLQKALSVKPDSIEAQKAIVLLHLDGGRTAEALKVAREMQKQRPKDAVGYVVEGDIRGYGKSWNEAATAYRSGLKVSDATELAVKLHGALSAGSGQAEADKFAASWMSSHAKDSGFRMYLAENAGLRGDFASAIKQYQILLDAQPDNAVVLNNLAWASAQNKDPKALEYAERANTLVPNQPEYMDTLGVLLAEKGDAAQGVALLKKALALAPQRAAIRLNLARALIKNGESAAAKIELLELEKLGDKFPGQKEVEKLMNGL